MKKEEFIALYEKSLSGLLSPEEMLLLDKYEDDLKLELKPWDEESMGDQALMGEMIFGSLQASIEKAGKEDSIGQVVVMKRRWRMAAAVLLPLLLVGGWMLLRQRKDASFSRNEPRVSYYKNDIAPGTDKARLTLADGSMIELDSAGNGLLTSQAGVHVVKVSGGQLKYVAESGQHRTAAGNETYNLISTPRGGQFKLVLPDGTRVWLNAMSSLRFPTVFAGRERRVELSGQAYFEVAHASARPFKVALPQVAGGKMEVAVLGTGFDIMAYEEEKAVNTTLVEGSVRVDHGGQGLMLKPGEQAQLVEGGQLRKNEDVDVDEATAWKDGRFEFNGNIKGIMRQIARWYNVAVKYEGNVSDKAFGGAISRTANVSEVLKILELTGSIHFIVDGNTITVTP